MIDIVSILNDIGVYDTQTPRAANILSIQVGSLEYAPLLGIDLKYFLSDQFEFQNESFKAYLIEVLANEGINVSSVIEVVENLYSQLTFNIVPDAPDGSLIAR